MTVSVTLSFCTDAASALVSASTGGEPNAKVVAPDVARKRFRDKRKRTPSTALPPTEFRPRRGTSTISYPSPGNDFRVIVVGAWSCANYRQTVEPPGFGWRLVPAPLQRRIDAFDQRLSVERIVCAFSCRQNTVASIPKEIPSFVIDGSASGFNSLGPGALLSVRVHAKLACPDPPAQIGRARFRKDQ